jgi:uroporphyrinogen-III synthase
MSKKPPLSSSLKEKVIALPESRQLDVLSALCERRQAKVIRVPLVSILDSPQQELVVAWLREFIKQPPIFFIVLTGEGLRRLLSAADRHDLKDEFLQALSQVTKICRGPKPERVLKEVGLRAELFGVEPTTPGIISRLDTLELKGAKVAVQLYGEEPNSLLMDYLKQRGVTDISSVAPYIYAPHSDAEKIQELILDLEMGKIDMLAFTSMPQVRRLFKVAKDAGLADQLALGLERVAIAAIGPVVAQLLRSYDCEVDVMPDSAYFMKPLVRAMEEFYDER